MADEIIFLSGRRYERDDGGGGLETVVDLRVAYLIPVTVTTADGTVVVPNPSGDIPAEVFQYLTPLERGLFDSGALALKQVAVTVADGLTLGEMASAVKADYAVKATEVQGDLTVGHEHRGRRLDA